MLQQGVLSSNYLSITKYKLHLAGLKSELLIRFYFNSVSLNILAGGVPTCNNCSLLLKGFYEEPSQSQKRREIYYGNTPLVMPFINFQRVNQTLTLAANTEYSIVLSGLRGIFAGLIFTIRAAVITGANQSNYVAVDSYDLQNSSGESIIGYYRMKNADHKIQ